MTFNLLLGDSLAWTMLFFALVVLALLSQHSITERVHYPVRGLIKAVPAFFLAGLSWHFNGPLLLTVAFLLCACGDFLLDVSKATYFWLFGVGAGVFAIALICLSLAYLERPVDSRPLLPLSLINIVLSLFVCVWILPNIESIATRTRVGVLGGPGCVKHHRIDFGGAGVFGKHIVVTIRPGNRSQQTHPRHSCEWTH